MEKQLCGFTLKLFYGHSAPQAGLQKSPAGCKMQRVRLKEAFCLDSHSVCLHAGWSGRQFDWTCCPAVLLPGQRDWKQKNWVYLEGLFCHGVKFFVSFSRSRSLSEVVCPCDELVRGVTHVYRRTAGKHTNTATTLSAGGAVKQAKTLQGSQQAVNCCTCLLLTSLNICMLVLTQYWTGNFNTIMGTILIFGTILNLCIIKLCKSPIAPFLLFFCIKIIHIPI